MSSVQIDDTIRLEYEDRGNPSGPPVVLIMGFAMQLVAWPDRFCALLTAQGLRVIRFDNRDIGLSSRLNHLGQPSPWSAMARRMLGLPVNPPYRLSDMAGDVRGLLDRLGIPRAHVVGASMGGMIAQWLAIRNPDRVSSLCSLMSTTGQLRYAWPAPGILPLLLQRPGPSLEDRVAHGIRFWKAITSPGDPPRDEELRRELTGFYERSSDLNGFWRQYAAIVAETSRVPALRRIKAPSLVIHGDADPLIRPAAGRATAAAIPGARFALIPGMGHDLRPAYLQHLARLIGTHVAAAEN